MAAKCNDAHFEGTCEVSFIITGLIRLLLIKLALKFADQKLLT